MAGTTPAAQRQSVRKRRGHGRHVSAAFLKLHAGIIRRVARRIENPVFKEIRNQDYYELLRDHPLVQHLRGKLWHATSVTNYLAIKDEGCIKPNDGTMIGVLKRRGPKLTVCEKLDAVSLFDFDQSEDRIFPLYEALPSIGEYFLEWGKFSLVVQTDHHHSGARS